MVLESFTLTLSSKMSLRRDAYRAIRAQQRINDIERIAPTNQNTAARADLHEQHPQPTAVLCRARSRPLCALRGRTLAPTDLHKCDCLKVCLIPQPASPEH